jgi:hypothetical protein
VCRKSFTDVVMKVQYKQGFLTVSFKDKRDRNNDNFEDCFKFEVDLDYEGYFFLAANSGKALNNYHYINDIKMVDLD